MSNLHRILRKMFDQEHTIFDAKNPGTEGLKYVSVSGHISKDDCEALLEYLYSAPEDMEPTTK